MIFVVELTPAIDSSGTLQTWYFTDGDGLATRPSDTPANTYIEPRLIDPGLIRRELFAGGELLGPVRSDYGEIVLANVDGALDSWIDYGIAGHAVIIRASADPTAAYPAGWTTVLVTQMERISVDFSELREAVGYGIRWTSPLGPIRIEFGYPLDRQDGEDSMVTLFSFGAPL